MINFSEKKAEKDGIITPKALLENTLKNVGEIEEIIIAMKTKDGEYKHAVSTVQFQEALGLLGITKHNMIQDFVHGE